jgi:hypothetical protein
MGAEHIVPRKVAVEKTVAKLRGRELNAKDDNDNQTAAKHKAEINRLQGKQ